MTLKHYSLNDFNNYFSSQKKTAYTFFGIETYLSAKLRNFHEKGVSSDQSANVFEEWLTIDNLEIVQTKKCYSLSQVLSGAGGVLNIIRLASGLVFCYYSKVCYKVDAINDIIEMHIEKYIKGASIEQPYKMSSLYLFAIAKCSCLNKKLSKKFKKSK